QGVLRHQGRRGLLLPVLPPGSQVVGVELPEHEPARDVVRGCRSGTAHRHEVAGAACRLEREPDRDPFPVAKHLTGDAVARAVTVHTGLRELEGTLATSIVSYHG